VKRQYNGKEGNTATIVAATHELFPFSPSHYSKFMDAVSHFVDDFYLIVLLSLRQNRGI
jgi:hypothetical protein